MFLLRCVMKRDIFPCYIFSTQQQWPGLLERQTVVQNPLEKYIHICTNTVYLSFDLGVMLHSDLESQTTWLSALTVQSPPECCTFLPENWERERERERETETERDRERACNKAKIKIRKIRNRIPRCLRYTQIDRYTKYIGLSQH